MAYINFNNGAYHIRITKYEKGKRLFRRMTWRPDQALSKNDAEKEALLVAVRFEENQIHNTYIDNKMSFCQFTEKWMDEYAKVQVRPRTYERYKSLLVRINKGIGHIKLNKLQPLHIIEFLNSLIEGDNCDDIKYKASMDIKTVIKGRGLFLKDVSKDAGMSAATLYQITHNKFVSKEKALALCEFLDIKLQECFVGNKKEPKPLGDKTIL